MEGKRTYVDRIDVSRISKCPHEMTVKVVEKLGISIFVHSAEDGDGRPCGLLNSLKLDAETLNREDATLAAKKAGAKSVLELLDIPSCYARLASDPELTKRLSDELEKEQDMKRLEEKFLKLVKNKNVSDVIEALCKYSKRDELLHNVAAVWSKHRNEVDLAHCYPLVSEWIEQYYRKKREKS